MLYIDSTVLNKWVDKLMLFKLIIFSLNVMVVLVILYDRIVLVLVCRLIVFILGNLRY